MLIGRPSMSRMPSWVAWRQAFSSTISPIGTIRPLSSAKGMKSAGETLPRVGWFQRTSASTATVRAGVEVDDRLVVHRELAPFDRHLELAT